MSTSQAVITATASLSSRRASSKCSRVASSCFCPWLGLVPGGLSLLILRKMKPCQNLLPFFYLSMLFQVCIVMDVDLFLQHPLLVLPLFPLSRMYIRHKCPYRFDEH